MEKRFIAEVETTLKAEGISFNGHLKQGLKRHNDSLSDNSSVFVKVLGPTNTSDAFVREIGIAKLLSFAPKPLMEEPLNVRGKFITAWEYIEGKEVLCEEATEEDTTTLVQNLFEIYATPSNAVRFHVGALGPEAIERRLHKAYQEDKIPSSLLKNIETVVQYHVLDFLNSASAYMMSKETLIHGDPHMGNLLKSSDGVSRLIDYESAKKAPIEYDLAAIFQNQSQIHNRQDLWESSYSLFSDLAMETTGKPVDDLLLRNLILFKNAQSLTYLIAFGNWDIIDDRVGKLLKAIKTNFPPTHLMPQVGL
jgi:thiamine kinase-like enzyme